MEPSIDFFNNKRVLITGGGGYLGSKLAEKIVNSDSTIFLLDKKFNSAAKTLSENHSNIQISIVDLTQKKQVEEICSEAEPDYIFHFAALLNRVRDFSVYNKLYEVNVNGTLNLLEAAKDIAYKGFYFASSGEVYGTKNQPPFSEEQIPVPVSPYSLTKLMGEQIIQTFSDISSKPFTILRIFNFYGPGMPKDFFISQLIEALKSDQKFNMTGGEQIRDLIYLEDLLAAIVFICKSGKSNNDIINICSGRGIILKEIAQEIAEQMNKTNLLNIGVLPYRKNEVWNMCGSNSKLTNLGFTVKNQNLISKIQEYL